MEKKDIIVAHCRVEEPELMNKIFRYARDRVGEVVVLNPKRVQRTPEEIVAHSKGIQAVVDGITEKIKNANVLVFCSETVATWLPDEIRLQYHDSIKIILGSVNINNNV